MAICPEHLLNESTLQAEFYKSCCTIELPCALELVTPVGRLDAVIFCQHWIRLLAIVEIKHRDKFDSHQIWRYKRIGVPVFGLNQFARTDGLARQLKRDYFDNSLHPGVTLDYVMSLQRQVRGKGRWTQSRVDRIRANIDEDVNFRNN